MHTLNWAQLSAAFHSACACTTAILEISSSSVLPAQQQFMTPVPALGCSHPQLRKGKGYRHELQMYLAASVPCCSVDGMIVKVLLPTTVGLGVALAEG